MINKTLNLQDNKIIQCYVKSKYIGKWQLRKIKLNCTDNRLQILRENDKNGKIFNIDEAKFHNSKSLGTKNKYQEAKLQIQNARDYQIKYKQDDKKFFQFINKYAQIKLMDQMGEQLIQPAISINYFAPLRSRSFHEDYSLVRASTIQSQPQRKSLLSYQREDNYIKTQDWRVDRKNGGVIFINQKKKQNISKIVKYVVKRAISSGSFMGISFPTFAMKPQSMLQTYCKCLGAVPLIMKNISDDPIDRIKAFNAIIFTISIQFNDIDKPFNPVIGQTFQGQIGGYSVYAQQTSHHPPVSSFMLDGQSFILHASLELNAKLSINSAEGLFYGEITLQFDDGGVVKGKMPSGTMSGVLFGETTFKPSGAGYCYDPTNKIVCTYQVREKDIVRGYIGKLKPKPEIKFQKNLETVQKYQKFKSISKNDYDKIMGQIEVIWSNQIRYDGKTYWRYDAGQNLPIKLQKNIKNKLKSDSTYREDIKLRADGHTDESQQLKQRTEEQERRLRKLRNKNTSNTKIK